jgi:hypothetical protein
MMKIVGTSYSLRPAHGRSRVAEPCGGSGGRTARLLIGTSFLLAVAAPSVFSALPPEKDPAAYSKREVFIVADSRWDVVLSWVSVAIWTTSPVPPVSRVRQHPLLIYHREQGDRFDADSVIHFLQKYHPDRVTLIGSPPSELLQLIASFPSVAVGAGLRPSQVRVVAPDSYPSYWRRLGAVVYTERDYGVALQASVFASLIDAPLVIAPRRFPGAPPHEPAEFPPGLDLERMPVICVGEVQKGIRCTQKLSIAELQRLYVRTAASRYIVLVNPNDLGFGKEGLYQPEKSGFPIETTFSGLSLAAPALASARHALLVPIPLEANDCGPYEGTSNSAFLRADAGLENVLHRLFLSRHASPSYLAVVGSPQAIPYWSECGNSGTGAADWKYGSLDDEEPLLHVGRVYSVTTSDASAYVARALFYKAVLDGTYAATEFTGLAIAAPGFAADQVNAETIRTKTSAGGYATLCFTATGSSAQPTCDIYTNVGAADYAKRLFTSFADHGSAGGWAGTLASGDIPWLDLPYTFSLACQTNNFFGGGSGTFGPHWIRKGGLSYHASIPSTDGYDWELHAARALTGASRPSLGQIATQLIRRTDYNSEVKRMYVFLGDPAVVPRSKEVSW